MEEYVHPVDLSTRMETAVFAESIRDFREKPPPRIEVPGNPPTWVTLNPPLLDELRRRVTAHELMHSLGFSHDAAIMCYFHMFQSGPTGSSITDEHIRRLRLEWMHRTKAPSKCAPHHRRHEETLMHSLLLTIALAASPGSGYLAPLTIQLVAPRYRILVGEPLRMTAIWTATAPVRVMAHRSRLLIDRGTGFEEWKEKPGVIVDAMERGHTVGPTTPLMSTHVVGVAIGSLVGNIRSSTLAFSQPGRYRLQVVYGDEDNLAVSNSVSVDVMAPAGRDLELYGREISRRPDLLSESAGQYAARLRRLFDEFDESPYLARPFVIVMKQELIRAIQEAPDGFPLQGDVPRPLKELARRNLGDGPFDEDRLAVLAEMLERSGRRAEALETLRTLVTLYPNTERGLHAQWRLNAREPGKGTRRH